MTSRRIVRPLSDAAKERARQADPHDGRCLISCKDNAEAVHVAPRDLTKDLGLMTSVEWAWGLRQDRLNLDTRTNVMFLGKALHTLYKHAKWALLPQESIIDRFFYQPCHDLPPWMLPPSVPRPREFFPEFSEETFLYTFLPLSDRFSATGILRGVGADDATVHTYPFASLPVLTSHIHPKFVLLHLTVLLSKSKDNLFIANLVATHPAVEKVARLHAQWVVPRLPMESATEPSFVPIAFVREVRTRARERRHSDATCVGRVDYPAHLLLMNRPIMPRKICMPDGGYRYAYAEEGLGEGEMYALEERHGDVEMGEGSERSITS